MVKDSDTESQILETAREVFIQEGYDGARMQHIADKAGINKALLHYYYRTKENLFKAVFDRVFDEVMNRIFSLVASEDSLEDLIRVFFREHTGYLLREPRLPAFIVSEISLHPRLLASVFQKYGRMGIGRFSELVAKGKEEGNVDPDLDPIQLLINMLSLSVFPVIVSPVFREVFGLTQESTDEMMRERIEQLPGWVMKSISKK